MQMSTCSYSLIRVHSIGKLTIFRAKKHKHPHISPVFTLFVLQAVIISV